jgi:hypothetical protein
MTSMRLRRFTRWALGATLTLGFLTGAAGAAQAVILSEVDRPKITETGYDFGLNWDTFGAPLNGGHLYWDLTNGVVTPDLEGYLYLKNVSGNCAKMKVEYLDENSQVLATRYSAEHCASNDQMHQYWVDMASYGSSRLVYTRVKIISTPNGGNTWYLQGEQTWAVF